MTNWSNKIHCADKFKHFRSSSSKTHCASAWSTALSGGPITSIPDWSIRTPRWSRYFRGSPNTSVLASSIWTGGNDLGGPLFSWQDQLTEGPTNHRTNWSMDWLFKELAYQVTGQLRAQLTKGPTTTSQGINKPKDQGNEDQPTKELTNQGISTPTEAPTNQTKTNELIKEPINWGSDWMWDWATKGPLTKQWTGKWNDQLKDLSKTWMFWTKDWPSKGPTNLGAGLQPIYWLNYEWKSN